MTIFLVLTVSYCAGLLCYAGVLCRELRPVTLHQIRTVAGGPSGLIKTLYIRPLQSHGQYTGSKHSDTSRKYVGLTLSKYLYPGRAINSTGTVTFYALYSADRKSITHFAATAGTHHASAVRLYLDTCSYLMSTYYYLYMSVFLGLVFLKDIYRLLKGKANVDAEVERTYNESTAGRWHGRIMTVFMLFLIL